MYGLPEGVTALNEDPYNVQGTVSWYCQYSTEEQAGEVLKNAFPSGPVKGFAPLCPPEPKRAMVTWEVRGSAYLGEVLVDKALKPVGFYMEVHSGYMVLTLDGSHIPHPRFSANDPQLSELVY